MYILPLLFLGLLLLIGVYAYFEFILTKPKEADKWIWVGFGDNPFRK